MRKVFLCHNLGYNALIEEKQDVINRINELLKPGGFLISLTERLYEKTSVASFLSFLMRIGIFPPMLKYFTVHELKVQ